MDTNERITRAAWAALKGDYPTETRPFFCLKFVRQVVEHALEQPSGDFYQRFLVRASSRKPEGTNPLLDPWAVDLEASVKHLGLAVPLEERRPGDLLFNYEAAKPYGHVAILLEHDLVAENIAPKYRPKSGIFPGSKALTPLEHFPLTLIARLPEGL